MSKGRPAHESAEKSHVAKSIEHDMQYREQPDYDDSGIYLYQDMPRTQKAKDALKKGKVVYGT